MSLAIVANPTAGRGRGEKVARVVQDILDSQGIDYELILTKQPREATELSFRACQKHEIVAALGGDGTIREVLEGVYQAQGILGIIPGGTGNDYARGLSIPLKPEAALQVLLAKHYQLMDIGREQDAIFGVLNSIGFPVTVIENVNAKRNRLLRGPLAILAGVYQTIRTLRSYPVDISIDGKNYTFSTVGLFLMNLPFGGGGLKFAPHARFNDHQLTVVVIEDISRAELIKTLPKVYRGGHQDHPSVRFFHGKDIIVESDPLPKMFDGDIIGTTPIVAKIHPSAVRVIIPKPGPNS